MIEIIIGSIVGVSCGIFVLTIIGIYIYKRIKGKPVGECGDCSYNPTNLVKSYNKKYHKKIKKKKK